MNLDLNAQTGFSSFSHLLIGPGEGGPVRTTDAFRTRHHIETIQRLSSKIGVGEGGRPA